MSRGTRGNSVVPPPPPAPPFHPPAPRYGETGVAVLQVTGMIQSVHAFAGGLLSLFQAYVLVVL